MRQTIHTDQAPQAIGPYVQGVVLADLVFTAGQIALRPDGTLVEGDIAEQTHQVLKNLKAIVEAASSSLDRVLKTTVFLTDLNDFAAMNEVYASYFPGNKPARTTVQVSRLPRGSKIEVECVAHR
ncbi:MAG: RidA family protein [Deinococcus sp.]|nr:RidA family protein [Deinococcus sp.]